MQIRKIARLLIIVALAQLANLALATTLEPIKPTQKCSVATNYCCVRYSDAIASADGPVLYAICLSRKNLPIGCSVGKVIETFPSDGSVMYYHVVQDAGINAGDKIISTFAELHPARQWFFDGKSLRCFLIGYHVDFELPADCNLLRVFERNGERNAKVETEIIDTLKQHRIDLEDRSIAFWFNHVTREFTIASPQTLTYTAVNIDDLHTRTGPIGDGIRQGLSSEYARTDVINFMNRWPETAPLDVLLEFLDQQAAISVWDRVQLANITSIRGDSSSETILIEHFDDEDTDIRDWARRAIAALPEKRKLQKTLKRIATETDSVETEK